MNKNSGKNGKNWLRGAVLAAFALLLTAAAPARAQEVATLNIRAVAQTHPIYKQWESDTDKMRQERQQVLDVRIRKEFNLPDNPDEATLTPEQQQQIQQILMAENQRFLDDMEPIREQKLLEVENDIIDTVKQIAEEDEFDLVLDSSVVLVGGTDITEKVIAAITAKTPAP